ncbi:MAG: hypothetical protein A2Y38_14335 [Spirochaetes bacterium GWB1_59_5]|nr:MAG: hypothetical protein A2Y38_14335 [Spirochaetes bacterium GWB1_59_5]
MRDPKYLALGVGVAALALGLVAIIALSLYSGGNGGRASLLVQYFRALSTDDEVAVAELTSSSFQSDLVLESLEQGTYELYDFGEEAEGTLKFLLVMPASSGEKRAVLAEMEFLRVGLTNRIESISRIDEGKRLTE